MTAYEYHRQQAEYATMENYKAIIQAIENDERITDRQYYTLRNIAIDNAYSY